LDAAAPESPGRAGLTPLRPPIVDEAGQAAVVSALQSGAATGDLAALRRIDTHLSRVFIAPSRVYKLSRARRHPFVDLSLPEQRRAAGAAEVSVNRRLAPDLYLRLAAVTRSADGLIGLDGPGEAVDWVVVMKPIAEGAILDEMADAGTLSVATVEDLAEAVASFHAALAPDRSAGRPAGYRRILDGLRATEAQGAAAFHVRRHSARLFAGLDAELARLSPRIEARRRAGFVRHGHGDLHLRNICVFEGKLTPFDALAFDPALATNDVLYDLAFLLMDLEARGLRAHASAAMNRYWDASNQPESALALLPFFMALRATVRMAVLTEGGDLAEAAAYRGLALRLLAPSRPRLAAIGGLSGTGKSVVARVVAPRLAGVCGARLLRSDVVRKRRAGVGETERLGDAAYAAGARAAVYRALARQAREALAAGAAVVADATFRETTARRAIEAAAKGHAFTGLWLRAAAKVRVARVAGRRGDASDITAERAAVQSEPPELGAAWRVLDAERPPHRVAAEAVRRIAGAADPPARDTVLEAKVRFLSAPRAYGGPRPPVRAIETHMSWVFLAGRRAYKLKKPVRFAYLDFSTLALREAACRAELSLNRRLAPDVYLDVVPLTRGPRGLSIDGPGEVVDWLVVMRRLDEAGVLESRLKNHVTDAELDRLAARLAAFYRRARPVRIAPPVHLTDWSRALADNRKVLLEPRLGLPAGQVRMIDRILRRFLRTQGARLAERVRRRRIIDAHGDLRPEHIWMGDPIRIIDCLEFSATLRANDPLDELAFLDMELERLGAPAIGRRISDKVLAALNEREPEPLYGFYRCHRAMLRARLSIAHMLEANPRTPEKWPRRARAYLALALADARRLERWLNRPSDRSAGGGRAAG
jgi:aminoglycoside phosphotransferase family enzyme/predicted kinase